jgi:starch phosphorylase
MKAALNGVPSLSVLDGWWIEGHVEGVTGWAIGVDGRKTLVETADSAAHATALYETLEHTVVPLFYRDRDRFTQVMRYAIALNGSFFTAQRMLQEYVVKAYGTDAVREPAPVPEAPTHTVAA